MRFLLAGGLLCFALVPHGQSPSPLPSSAPRPEPRGLGAAPPSPLIEARLPGGANGDRVALTCIGGGGTRLELDPRLRPFGGPTLGARAVVTMNGKDGVATCIAEKDGLTSRGAWRLRPLQIRAVTPSIAKDATHVIVSIDGQALGPLVAADDGVYLTWHGAVVRLAHTTGGCPEAKVSDDRIVACASADQVRGRGPAHIRVQSAGRLEEAAGAPIDLGAVLGRERRERSR